MVLLLAVVLGAPWPGPTAPGAKMGVGIILPGLVLILLALLLVCELPESGRGFAKYCDVTRNICCI